MQFFIVYLLGMFNNEYISLDRIATRLHLPQKYIQQQTKAGKIPHLIVGGRLRFQEKAVRAALDKIEQQAISKRKPTILSGVLE